MLKKPLNIFLLAIAGIILTIYISGYNYLFRGVRLTYLRGESSSTIDDGTYFPSHTISKGNSKPWPADLNYNKKSLSPELEKHLKETESVSFLFIQHGKLLQERYWDGYKKNTASNFFSMAKTVTVLLLGKAIDDGRIMNVNQKFSDFYPDFAAKEFGNNLTLRNLATMEAGLDWKENYKNPFSPNAAAYYGFSLADVVFQKNLKQIPGEKFEYQSGATQLLGFAVGRAVGMPLASYASAKLWKPLRMEQNAEWSTDETGIEKTFCCIQSNARDFAKLGSLLLHRGKVDGIPLINETFVDQMLTPTENSNGIYGMGVWTNYDAKIHHYYLRGLHGQYVIVVPEYDMIIVRLGNKEGKTRDSKNRPGEVEFYINEALKLTN
ncbi:beta-lactamase family protein [Epilithonimonas sp. JDS]|uniref:serine hydrolase domain-containing protein n=1 Tax=Epilithonimonas sp. JDS TaxID=2902797 RepID=UPI001E46B4C1|nr:serine hydrolase [Epilithonimonas sp. JDS]MCD9856472.1 beta-lactamase family protein [Epilithonimonas sp. JDS]